MSGILSNTTFLFVHIVWHWVGYLFQGGGYQVENVPLIKPLSPKASLVVLVDAELKVGWKFHEGHVVFQVTDLWIIQPLFSEEGHCSDKSV